MNNYSLLQKGLHHLALSSQFMREVTFDFEMSNSSHKFGDDNNIFIAGIARSGTTILLNAFYKSDIFASLTYKDMPFVLAPNIWSKLSFNTKNTDWVPRAHDDGIQVSTESPEALEEVFWKTFKKQDNETIDKFRTYVLLINHRYKKNRYLSKSNQNIKRLDFIRKIFPNSKILIPFRDPLQQAYSLLNQHKKFLKNSKEDKFISRYMEWIGHSEFGSQYIPIYKENLQYIDNANINHWLEQWLLAYGNILNSQSTKKNTHFICYEELCTSKEYWFYLLDLMNIDIKYDFNFVESKKKLSMRIDDELNEKAKTLYIKLRDLSTKK